MGMGDDDTLRSLAAYVIYSHVSVYHLSHFPDFVDKPFPSSLFGFKLRALKESRRVFTSKSYQRPLCLRYSQSVLSDMVDSDLLGRIKER